MIQTKVARILSPTQVVLAAGKAHGVREDMEFIIYDLGDEIFDPENGESLGQIELIKGRVRVVHVQDKISFAATPARQVSEPALTSFLERVRTVRDQLKVDEGAVAVQVDMTVRVGDKARSVP